MLKEIDNNDNMVVFETGSIKLDSQKNFNFQEALKISHTFSPLCYLWGEALKIGIKFVTPEYFLNLDKKPQKVFLISHLNGGEYNDKLMRDKGVVPLILTCQESSFIATRFYIGLKKYSSKFKHSFVFSGMKKHLSGKTIYHEMFFPQSCKQSNIVFIDYENKKFLTLISSAKEVKNWKKNLILKVFYGYSVSEIYQERIKAIDFFSDKNGFDLFGHGWGKHNSKELSMSVIQGCYRGVVENKNETLSKYRFVLCLENSIFPGYVTEKIFDAMLAGCVPIYYGAPDINQYVDNATFIDFRHFKNYQELYDFLLKIDKYGYGQYLRNITKYLNSEKYKKFTQEYFAEEILKILKHEI